MQESVLVLSIDVKGLENPAAHALHFACAVADPAVSVYFPGAHLVWAMQASVSKLFTDVKALKNPVAQDSHWGWPVVLPAIFVYLPGGHLVL